MRDNVGTDEIRETHGLFVGAYISYSKMCKQHTGLLSQYTWPKTCEITREVIEGVHDKAARFQLDLAHCEPQQFHGGVKSGQVTSKWMDSANKRTCEFNLVRGYYYDMIEHLYDSEIESFDV
jgi:hypothetical protein